MKNNKVIFIRSNLSDRDVRLPKEIKALKENGYLINVICWDREIKDSIPKFNNDIVEWKLRFKAPWGIMSIFFQPVWWVFVFVILIRNKWDVAHAVNLDCVIPAVLAGLIKRKPVVYEILDIYFFQIIMPKYINNIILFFDKLIMRMAQAVIVADEAQIEGLRGIPNNNVVVIYDSPPEDKNKNDCKKILNKDKYIIYYAGVLFKAKHANIDKVIQAITDIDDVKLIIAGYGDMVNYISEMVSVMPNKIDYIGKISYEEVIAKGKEADLFFILRDTNVLVNKYTCGSTLFNAMICGKPILVNKGSSTAIKVKKLNCGIVVDAQNINEIKSAIIRLKNNVEYSQELGMNGRQAYDNIYSWDLMKLKLIALYNNLLSDI
jgi:glycosyltransferase involved in cell wall biosynthesis